MNRAEKSTDWIRYCAAVITAVLALLCAVAAVNAFVDPFDMYRLWDIDGVNTYKPAIYHRVRLFKAYEVRRVQPQSVILGSSRTHLGLRCSHEVWKSLEGPCYNLAFDGATTREMFDYLRHAQAIRPLKHVVLGLDAYHTTEAPSFTRPDFDSLLLFRPHGFPGVPLVTGDLRLLTSFDTLRASMDTLKEQDGHEQNWFAPDGQRLGEVFFRRVEKNFVEAGPRAYFDEIDRLEVGFQTEGLVPVRYPARPLSPADPAHSSFSYIRRIVDFCLTEKIDLRIFITPAHVHQYEIAAATGAWPSIENGKRELVQLLAEAAAAHPDRPPISLYDFGAYSSVTMEQLPAVSSRDEMRYYWDSSHFKEAVGDYVLDRLFEVSTANQIVPADFGVRLTAETIEAELASQRSEQEAYRISHAEDVEHLRTLVDNAIHANSKEQIARY